MPSNFRHLGENAKIFLQILKSDQELIHVCCSAVITSFIHNFQNILHYIIEILHNCNQAYPSSDAIQHWTHQPGILPIICAFHHLVPFLLWQSLFTLFFIYFSDLHVFILHTFYIIMSFYTTLSLYYFNSHINLCFLFFISFSMMPNLHYQQGFI